jgi:hypothetical protein
MAKKKANPPPPPKASRPKPPPAPPPVPMRTLRVSFPCKYCESMNTIEIHYPTKKEQ